MQGEAGRPDHGAGAELRRRIHDAVKARFWGPLDRFLQDFFAPDVVVHYNCVKEGVPAPGVWLGREALGESIRQVDIEYEWLDVEVFDIVVDGDRAAVRWRAFWRNRGSGAPGAMELAHFLRFNNGLIVEMHEFLDNSSDVRPHRSTLRPLEEIISPPPPGLDRAEIERRARTLMTASASGPDLKAIRSLCAPDVICEFVGDRARIPYAGRHVGVEALVNIIRTIAVDFQQSSVETRELLVDGGRVAGRRAVEWRHHGTGRRGRVELAAFARFEKGLAVELIEYRDSIAVLEMQGDMDGP